MVRIWRVEGSSRKSFVRAKGRALLRLRSSGERGASEGVHGPAVQPSGRVGALLMR